MANILIAEDDDLIRRLYEKAFSFEEHEVRTAVDGRDAWKQIQANRPDILLLDIMMPHMNGLEVLDKVKSTDETKDLPIIVLTNLAGNEDAQEALDHGAVKYIIKSEHDPKEIVDMVNEILSGYTSRDLSSSK